MASTDHLVFNPFSSLYAVPSFVQTLSKCRTISYILHTIPTFPSKMIAVPSQIVVRYWKVLLLVALASADFTMARPHHHEAQPVLMRFCGHELTQVIDESCSNYKIPSYLDLLSLNQSSNIDPTSVPTDSELAQSAELSNRKRDSLLRQCCVIGCTEEDLLTFCHVDRNQIADAALQLRNEDLDMDWLYEFLPRFGAIPTPE